jgi:hypothetical protein
MRRSGAELDANVAAVPVSESGHRARASNRALVSQGCGQGCVVEGVRSRGPVTSCQWPVSIPLAGSKLAPDLWNS